MAPPKEVIDLVEHFERNADVFRSPQYNETQLRREFLDPFFKALGWDVANEEHNAEAYKDVIHEDAIKVGGDTKAPDYCFRIGGTRKFFVEAKRPAVNLKDDPAPAYQLRRYAWSSKLPLSVLTDFQELALYDCRIRPQPRDRAAIARVRYFTYKDYLEHWDDIAAILSKDAVLKGSFDRFVETTRLKRGTAQVDEAFLAEIEEWRKELASNIALRNGGLSQREVNFAVQRTIDRIIFLRICEDRGIEKYGQLRDLAAKSGVYSELCRIFEQADDKYNSGLFHFQKEKERTEEPDTLTLRLKIDDSRLKDILKRLYYPDSPYEFSVLPADILGQVYEQFLGKVIRLTAGHRAVVEDKPEVKKARGVYYTPTYIVDYIVKNTVGKLLEGKTPKQVSKLRILDPACGSGSFLIAAYQHLLDWHRDWYVNDGPEKHRKELYQGPGGDWRLTIAERKRILRSNIYGVDIDSQAVEVTKLSLLLKVLEGESDPSLKAQLLLIHKERALPDLGHNIKCGNSLIGPDFYHGQQMSLLDDEERFRVNALDWNAEFPEVMYDGGFDAVIGNPPYGALFTPEDKEHLFRTFPAIKGQPESYEYFLNRALELTTNGGWFSFIVPTNFIESDRAEGLRTILLEQGLIRVISSFRYNVWRKNAAETLVLVFQKKPQKGPTRIIHPATPHEFTTEAKATVANQSDWYDLPGRRFLIRANAQVIRKMEANAERLGDVCDLSQGIIVYKTRADSARNLYISDKPRDSSWKKLLDTKSTIGRYALEWGKRYLKYGSWLWCPRDDKYFEEPKILFVRLRNKALARKLIATFDNQKYYNRDNFNNIIGKDPNYSLKYVLSVFNSKAANYWYKAHFDNVNINPAQVRLIPIPRIAIPGKRMDNQLAALADRILELNHRLGRARTGQERIPIQRQIDSTDRQIDQLVYQLYGLTDEEIALVESATAPSPIRGE